MIRTSDGKSFSSAEEFMAHIKQLKAQRDERRQSKSIQPREVER